MMTICPYEIIVAFACDFRTSVSYTLIYYQYVIKMPVVTIETWTGKSVEQKAKLMKGIKKAFEDIGVDPAGLTIIIHDIPRYNWAKSGKQVSTEP